jgi:hypothetical protein
LNISISALILCTMMLPPQPSLWKIKSIRGSIATQSSHSWYVDRKSTRFCAYVNVATRLTAISGTMWATECLRDGPCYPLSSASIHHCGLWSLPSYTWITISWTFGLTAAVLVSVGGRLSEICVRRYFLLSGASLAFTGTIVDVTGKSIGQMIASDVILGIGSGFQ